MTQNLDAVDKGDPVQRSRKRRRPLMQRSEFVVVYMPFEASDMTLESLEYGVDEAEALREFRMNHPTARVKEVKSK
jgi:predicted DNA-binding protein (UPF0251 family)